MGIRQRLNLSRLYLCTDLRTEKGDFFDFVRAVFAGGVDLLQVRDKKAAPEAVAEAISEVRRMAPMRSLVVVNDSPQIAGGCQADVLHIGQGDMPPGEARGYLHDHALIGRSTHSVEQADAANADGDVDYFCVGPVHATPTKPTYVPVGLDLVRHAARIAPPFARDAKPWFAIGGINAGTLEPILDAGARRIVVVRALTQASDPEAAARELRTRLDEAWAEGRTEAEQMRDAWTPGTEGRD